jgi:DNA mismatch endonuclease (patch repair protein)
VNARRRIAIFMHGCFWHRHHCALGARAPKSRIAFWKAKFVRNVLRDREVRRQLRAAGWRALVVWECEMRSPDRVARKIRRFLDA